MAYSTTYSNQISMYQQGNGSLLSPTMRPDTNSIRLSMTRARFNASRSFELEDDIEFCPIISDEEIKLQQGQSGSLIHSTPPQQMNEQIYMRPMTYSGSPAGRQAALVSKLKYDRAIDIVDPATGVKISPVMRHASPARTNTASNQYQFPSTGYNRGW